MAKNIFLAYIALKKKVEKKKTFLDQKHCLTALEYMWGNTFFLGDKLFPTWETHITRQMFFSAGGTHINKEIIFPGGGTHITRNMCFPGGGTHISRDMCYPSG